MRSSYRKATLLSAVVALLGVVIVADDASASWDTNPLSTVVTNQHYLCGNNDLPEGPIQGHVPKADQDSGRAQQGYNCGLSLVGHTEPRTVIPHARRSRPTRPWRLAYVMEPTRQRVPHPARSRSKWELDLLSRHGDQHGE
jgi:hypothetical protein